MGGGIVVIPTIILLFNISPKNAVPVGSIVVLIATLLKSVKEIFERHPTKGWDRPLMDYNIAILFNVMVVLGTTFGVWINRIVPNLALAIAAFLMLS